jgi:DNA polymerase-1
MFNQIWVCDFGFISKEGERPKPICFVGTEFYSGETYKIWLEGVDKPHLPFDVKREDVAYCAYYSIAEFTCHLALNWDLPTNVLDLFSEYRIETNGYLEKNGLLDACKKYGIPTISYEEKDRMRDRILQGTPYSDTEKTEILGYCETDVIATTELFRSMESILDTPRALYRGQYMVCNAIMEHNGIPLDKPTLDKMIEFWEVIKIRLIKDVDADFGFYDGTVFKMQAFEEYLQQNNMAWELTPTGLPKLDDDTFKDMSKVYPQLTPIRDLRNIMGKLKIKDLPVGSDNRNRSMLSPFGTKTGRNTPKVKFIFVNPSWIRSLIRPEPGKALAYIDYGQEEFYIAAIFSQDKAMQEAYESGDPYLAFAKLAGAVPHDATKQSHKEVRDLFKTCCLGVQYGMKAQSLAIQIGKPVVYAKELIHHHQRLFKGYWDWQNNVAIQAKFNSHIQTEYGWKLHLQSFDRKEDATVRNFMMQSTGAEILRMACIKLVDAGVKICAPVHDALLCEFDLETVDADVKRAEEVMQEASRIVLGKPLKTDAEIVKYPDRYIDKRGIDTWNRVNKIIENIEKGVFA